MAMEDVVEGFVGKQASKQFWKYRNELDLINVEEALKNQSYKDTRTDKT